MHMRNKWLTILLAFVMLLAACEAPANGPGTVASPGASPAGDAAQPSPAESALPAASVLPAVALTDLMGRQVSVRGVPQRIVSLSPAATEILFALGAEKTVVAVGQDSDYPDGAAALTKIDASDVSAVEAQKPDLVFVGREYPEDAVTALTAQGIPVACADADTYGGIYGGIALTAQLVRAADSAGLVGSMQQKAQEIADKAAELADSGAQPTALLVLDYKDGRITAAGPKSLAFGVIGQAGGIPAAADSVTDAYPVYTAEQLKALSPDVLLVSSKLDIESLTGEDAFKYLAAVREGRIYSVDATLITRPGPRIVDGIQAVCDALELSVTS